jgi:hypothetical protein
MFLRRSQNFEKENKEKKMIYSRPLKIIVYLLLISTSLLYSEDEKKEEPKIGWNNEVIGSLNLTQASFDNWSGGGENSLAWQFKFLGKFMHEQTSYNWTTTGKIEYGQTKLGDLESRKSIDEIRLESIYTRKINLYVNPYVAVTGETQLTKGYKYSETSKTAFSDFFDPAYFTQSAGIGYSPNDQFKTRLGAALKETITRNFPTPFADDPDTKDKIEKTKVELGAESVTDYTQKLAEKMLFTSKLELFSNFKALNEVDVRWDNILTAEVSKYVNVNLNFKLFYDRDISVKRQLKQSLALGLTYTFL